MAFTFGKNKFGQLGIGPDISDSLDPIEIQLQNSDDGPVECWCGWSHSGFRTRNGMVYMWGRNDKGQLALNLNNESEKIIYYPRRIYALDSARKIVVGSEHGIAITNNMEFVTFGWNEHGNCGTGNLLDVIDGPKLIYSQNINGEDASDVGCGYGHTLIVTSFNIGLN